MSNLSTLRIDVNVPKHFNLTDQELLEISKKILRYSFKYVRDSSKHKRQYGILFDKSDLPKDEVFMEDV